MKPSDIENAVLILRMIQALTAEECSGVAILNDNTDFTGRPDCRILVNTLDSDECFSADSLLDCLTLAMSKRGDLKLIELSEIDKKPGRIVEFVYTWPDGREEVRYRRPAGGYTATKLMAEIDNLRLQTPDSPYSYREVDGICL